MVEAVEDLLAGTEVRVPVTEPKGCLSAGCAKSMKTARSRIPIRSPGCSMIVASNAIARVRSLPFAMTSYDEVAGWGEMIAEVIREQRMPPWHANPKHGSFANEDTLTEDEKGLVYAWVENGCPEGDPAQLPEPPKFPAGYLLPREPDQVVYIADEPVDVMAEGTEPYRYYTVDPGFTEDKWVKMAECVPGNPAVVHHIIVFIVPPERTPEERAAGERARRARQERAEAEARNDHQGPSRNRPQRR